MGGGWVGVGVGVGVGLGLGWRKMKVGVFGFASPCLMDLVVQEVKLDRVRAGDWVGGWDRNGVMVAVAVDVAVVVVCCGCGKC